MKKIAFIVIAVMALGLAGCHPKEAASKYEDHYIAKMYPGWTVGPKEVMIGVSTITNTAPWLVSVRVTPPDNSDRSKILILDCTAGDGGCFETQNPQSK